MHNFNHKVTIESRKEIIESGEIKNSWIHKLSAWCDLSSSGRLTRFIFRQKINFDGSDRIIFKGVPYYPIDKPNPDKNTGYFFYLCK